MVNNMMSFQCIFCKHLYDLKNKKPSCEAFPMGVPREMLTGEADHRKAYEGDNGIKFESIDE